MDEEKSIKGVLLKFRQKYWFEDNRRTYVPKILQEGL